jgi:hypothetical protein
MDRVSNSTGKSVKTELPESKQKTAEKAPRRAIKGKGSAAPSKVPASAVLPGLNGVESGEPLSTHRSRKKDPAQPPRNLYLVWFDDNPKKPTVLKIDEALARYREKYEAPPNVVLVHAECAVEHELVQIVNRKNVRPNTFYVGYEDDANKKDAPTRVLTS